MDKKRQTFIDSGARTNKSIILEIKEDNKLVDKTSQGNTLEFNSLTSCISYLRSLGLKTKRDTLSKYKKMETHLMGL